MGRVAVGRGVAGKHLGARPHPRLASGSRPAAPGVLASAAATLPRDLRGGGRDVGRPTVVGMQAGASGKAAGRDGGDWATPAREERASTRVEGGMWHGMRLRFRNLGPKLAF